MPDDGGEDVGEVVYGVEVAGDPEALAPPLAEEEPGIGARVGESDHGEAARANVGQ